MKKNFKVILFSILAMLSLSMTAVFATEVKAENALTSDICSSEDYDETQKAAAGCSENRTAGNVAVAVIDIVIGLVAVLSVAMLIYGGAKYVISVSRPDKIEQSKKIIMYSVIGLAVALLAYAIVNFVLSDGLSGSGPAATGGTTSGDASSGGSSGSDGSGGNSKTVVELDDLDSCKKKEHSTCTVDGVEFVRLKDGNLWAKSWDSSLNTFDAYMNYSCPVGKKPTQKIYQTLISKYSGGELHEQLAKISFFGDTTAQNATVYWSTTKVSGTDNVYLLHATKSDTTIVSYLPANPDIKNGSSSYGILCYVDSK
ncbi:hypothetical protein IJH02_00880 [Candidatus Saccharibacteria bacterium]|nr:hypothetical protein [Candidatus Saccharibacteria bacterium]